MRIGQYFFFLSPVRLCIDVLRLSDGSSPQNDTLMLQQFLYAINLLKPTGHVMHQQFNIQQL